MSFTNLDELNTDKLIARFKAAALQGRPPQLLVGALHWQDDQELLSSRRQILLRPLWKRRQQRSLKSNTLIVKHQRAWNSHLEALAMGFRAPTKLIIVSEKLNLIEGV